MIQLNVKIKKKVFFSDETGYGVFKAVVKGGKDIITIVGNLLDIREGEYLEVEGEQITHPRFGEQIKVSTYKPGRPADEEGMIHYLSSGRFKGIGRRTAEKIVREFGKKTLDILEKQPEKIDKIKGIRKIVKDEIKNHISQNVLFRDLVVRLSPLGIGNDTVFRIIKIHGNNTKFILENNPYSLIKDIRGIGFKTADVIAQGFGLTKENSFRIQAGLEFVLSQAENKNGDLYMVRNDLQKKTIQLLGVPGSLVIKELELLLENGELVSEKIPEEIIVSARNRQIEKRIAQRLFLMNQSPLLFNPADFHLDAVEKKIGFQLTEEQKNAVESALFHRISIITGGPGTGKTTVIRAVIEALLSQNQSVLIAAPTGRAAKRVEEASQFQASTIHRLLKYNPQTHSFVHNEEDPLDADAVIVDEFSMVDTFLFLALLKAVSNHSRLIIIGDKDQLPSVGPGNVMRDIIKSGYFKIVYLKRNFRQDAQSLIIENAYYINCGQLPVFKAYTDELDFVYIQVETEQQAVQKILNILNFYKERYSFNSHGLQILSPMYRGNAGIDNINRLIQEQFNPEQFVIKNDKCAYKKNDKVMQIKNNYEKEIFNGEQGLIDHYDAANKCLWVDFSGFKVQYYAEDLEELTLSYAVSVHKSQGSEYDILVLVLLPSHSIMLNRELFYTAVTRAKKRLLLVSDQTTVQAAITNSSPRDRKTLLNLRLKEFFTSLPH